MATSCAPSDLPAVTSRRPGSGTGERDLPQRFPLSSLSPLQEESFICSFNASGLSRSFPDQFGLSGVPGLSFLASKEEEKGRSVCVWGGGDWGSDFLSLCGFQKKIMHVKINDANICILCIKETNSINADYSVFLRTVHHTLAPGRGRQAQPVPLSSGFALGQAPGSRHIRVIVSWTDSGSSSEPASVPSVSS